MKKLIARVLPKIIGTTLNIQALFDTKGAAQRTFSIFCKTRAGRPQDSHQDFLNTSTRETVSINGFSIATYHWKGTGPRVVLFHGWESYSHRWRKMIQLLQKNNYDIYAMDAPGHGHSSGHELYVPLYTIIVKEYIPTINPDYVVAHSMGGMMSLYYAHKHGWGDLKKLVLMGAPSRLDVLTYDFQRILGFSNRVLNSLDDYLLEKFGLRYSQFNMHELAHGLELETLIVHDKEDPVIQFSDAESIHKNLPNSTLAAINNGGHRLTTKSANEAVLNFLKS